jgi:hypothetical protein
MTSQHGASKQRLLKVLKLQKAVQGKGQGAMLGQM